MKIKKEDIKKIINILESKHSELKDGEYFEFKGNNLVKNIIPFDINKWCIRQDLSEDICKWFRPKGLSSAKTSGNYRYMVYHDGEGFFKDYPVGQELTEKEFNKYIKDKI